LQTKTLHNFHLINQNGMIQSFLYIYKFWKSISNFCFWKMWFFLFAQTTQVEKQTKYHTIIFNLVGKSYENYWGLKWKLCLHVVQKFQRKKIKIPFVVSCPKLLPYPNSKLVNKYFKKIMPNFFVNYPLILPNI